VKTCAHSSTLARRRSRSFFRSAWAAPVFFFSCAPQTGTVDTAPLAVPFAVSDYYSPTGYMGDGVTVGVVNMLADGTACPSRAPGAVGDCYQITYTPPVPSANGWAGVYWQYPENNWGAYAGHAVRPGATQVTLYAMGGNGGEQVSFKVGGIADDTQPNHDSIDITAPAATLTTQWQPISIPFDGATYSEVLGAFAWVVNVPVLDGGVADTQPVVFYLDAIRWSP
jgi:hypothetical protein